MQVKKFEAKSMKEALDMVKTHLGPEAIILSAKDTHRGFGLAGEKSVEVTAAVTEETLRKKRIAESKLREDLREKFQKIPASKQKEFINKVFKDHAHPRLEMVGAAGPTPATARVEAVPAQVREQLKGLRYADIADEEPQADARGGRDRVRRAAERARQASQDVLQDNRPKRRPATTNAPVTAAPVAANPAAHAQISALESQLAELKSIVEKFQTIPQIPLSMHPGAEQGLPFELSGAYQKLTAQGWQPASVTQVLKRAMKEMDQESLKKPALVDAWVVRHLLDTVEVSSNPLAGRYHVFMGSTGQGKTTSLVKFASHLLLKERRTIAFVSLDTQKLGAAEQLRLFAQILNVPFTIVRRPEEWWIAEQKLKNVQHILVDCPGFSLKTQDEIDWLKRMVPPAELGRVMHYVQSILARDDEAIEIAARYQAIGFHDVVFTRVDESGRQGLILNFQERFRSPVHSFGMGPAIPEDFEIATKERIIYFIFKLSKPHKF